VNTSIPPVPTLPYLPFRRISLRTAAWAVATGMALVLPASYLIHFLPLPAATVVQAETTHKLMTTSPLWLIGLKSLLVYPLLEECIYRGIMLQMLRRSLPLWAALLPPTLLFGVTHLGYSPQNAVFAGIAGLYLAWLSIRSGSLLTSIACHSAINLFVVFLLPLVASRLAITADPRMLFSAPLLCLFVVSLAVLTMGIRRLRNTFGRPGATFGVASPAAA